MTECPKLTELKPDTEIITIDLLYDLIVSTYDRTIGTNVTVRCQTGLTLVGSSTVKCMPSGYWSSEPLCTSPSTEAPTDTTSGLDESIVLIIILVNIICLVVTLIVFVCMSMCWDRSRRKKLKRYGDIEYKFEDTSSQANSIPGHHARDIKMCSRDSQHSSHGGHPDMRYHQHYAQHYQPDEITFNTEYYAPRHQGQRYQQHPPRRHYRHKCPHCAHTFNTMRHAHSLNDIQDEAQRIYHTDVRAYRTNDDDIDEDKAIRDERRDGYLWSKRHSLSNWNIPRPFYEP